MTMSVNDENSAGAANNNNCSKVDLDHYDNPGGGPVWAPCPPPPLASGAPWMGPEVTGGEPTYTPLVKVGLLLFFPPLQEDLCGISSDLRV